MELFIRRKRRRQSRRSLPGDAQGLPGDLPSSPSSSSPRKPPSPAERDPLSCSPGLFLPSTVVDLPWQLGQSPGVSEPDPWGGPLGPRGRRAAGGSEARPGCGEVTGGEGDLAGMGPREGAGEAGGTQPQHLEQRGPWVPGKWVPGSWGHLVARGHHGPWGHNGPWGQLGSG